MDSPTEILSDYISKVKFENIPNDVIKYTKDKIIDSLGCAIGGTVLTPTKVVINYFKELGGNPEASVLGTCNKLPCLHAVYINSYAANSLDFDDNSNNPDAHPGSTIIPPAFSVAEKLHASGKDFLTAIITAYETWAHIAQAIEFSPARRDEVWGFGVHQVFAAAITTSKLLKFDKEQVVNTLGLAGVNAPVPCILKFGFEPEERPVSWVKNNFGWASMGGVLAAFLTQRGFKGHKHILDGKTGFWVMAGSDQCDFTKITANLGDYLTANTGLKRYSVSYMMQTIGDAIEIIMSKHPISADNIKSIKIKSHHFTVDNFGVDNPTSIMDAQFSVPHMVALQIIGKSSRKGLSESDLNNREVRALATKVSVELSSRIEEALRRNQLVWASEVYINFKDGSQLSASVDIPKWESQGWPTEEELHEKFIHLTAPIISENTSKSVITDICKLENIEDVATIITKISKGV